jgi:hypothetical protein
MQVILDPDEAWSLMTLVTGYIIDNGGLSQDGKQRIRRWRTDRALGTVEMDDLAVGMNKALGTFIDEKTNRQIRAKGRYARTKDAR